MSKILTGRGWGLVAVGAAALVAAQVLGRRDLLYVGVFLVTFPLLATVLLGWLRPRFEVERRFLPQAVGTGATATVELAVRPLSPPDGPVSMRETLPARFGESPSFSFPGAVVNPDGASRYEYKFRSARRGVFDIGPVAAEFTDPFGLGRRQQNLGEASPLIVTPTPVDLPSTGLTGSAGLDGSVVTRIRANPSDDDVMTREYRHGDPMRRVHWGSTARQGSLMVRREEAVSAPYATLVLDQRAENFTEPDPLHSRPALHSRPGLHARSALHVRSALQARSGLPVDDAFEWAVTAAVSAAVHLLERGYNLRFLDTAGRPALLRSASAPAPEDEEFSGAVGLQSVAEGLAALDVSPSGHHGSTSAHGLARRLAAHKTHGPLVAVLGRISTAEAEALSLAALPGQPAFALLAVRDPADVRASLEVLRRAGWRAQAASPSSSLPAVWAGFDANQAVSPEHPDAWFSPAFEGTSP